MDKDIAYMRLALEEANAAADRDEVPIGAVLVHSETGEVVSRAGNRTRELSDPSAHAEMLVIRDACQKNGAQRIPGYDLYVTLEPCTMCAATISFARINRVVIGADDPKGGGILHGSKFYEQRTCHWRPAITQGLLQQECGAILKQFFQSKRTK
ncbi:MAG: tRNA-specific adenosine deaminase [Micavibrio sp.]|nr:tRNA-specific adenosine deaminase [Micavibrio sp.]|tara:strand:- start:162 stop:623 length:462 start_codon:yes stop_codon:yes gene_type:complete